MLQGEAFWKCGARSKGLGLEPSMWGSTVGKKHLAGRHIGCAAAVKSYVDMPVVKVGSAGRQFLRSPQFF